MGGPDVIRTLYKTGESDHAVAVSLCACIRM